MDHPGGNRSRRCKIHQSDRYNLPEVKHKSVLIETDETGGAREEIPGLHSLADGIPILTAGNTKVTV